MNAYTETPKKIIGFRKKGKKRLTHDTWKKTDKRRLAIDKLLSAKSPRKLKYAGYAGLSMC